MPYIDPDDTEDPEYGIYGKRPVFPLDSAGQTVHVGHWQRWLNFLERSAVVKLGEYFAATFGDADWPDVPPFDAPEDVKDAYVMFTQIASLRRRLAEGDVWGVLQHAHHVGMLEERGEVRWAERYAQDGRDREADRRRGGAATKKLTAEEEKLVVGMMDEEIRKGANKTKASVRVAAKFCSVANSKTISGKTVLNTWKKSKENA